MRTITVNISEAIIKEKSNDYSIKELNDARYPIRFRYLSDRTKGSWFYDGGKVRYKWIGRWPLVRMANIKSMLPQIEINLASGMNHEAAVIGHFETVSDLLKWHLSQAVKTRALSQLRKTGIKSIINCNLLPYIGSMYLSDIARPVLLERFFTPIQADYSISTVYSAWCVLKSAFRAACAADLLPVNPVEGMRVSDFVKEKIKPKASKLEERHLPVLFSSLTDRKYNYDSMLGCLILLHGTRIGETRQARWDQFDFIDNTWNIPESITKGVCPALKVMLTETSIELLKRHKEWQKKRGYNGVWLFKGSERSPMTPKQANDAIQRVSDRKWTAHDLRKAYRDVLTEVNTDSFVAERMLNHSLTMVQKTYNQKEQSTKARQANERAHEWILNRI
ncbi:tyrosine-type recombinase/integrase [Vibrio lentus]|uniref:tyrosine-type recombinase/integrase n=1 Tax=Vibrio lentus TaxID=136468 RepID=UPI000C8232D3|nr:tyrosine-type recombinase/integrase [Vibrio lentus]PMI58283.1 hypothetical protein BCU41_03885 [Vibrio lentus]